MKIIGVTFSSALDRKVHEHNKRIKNLNYRGVLNGLAAHLIH